MNATINDLKEILKKDKVILDFWAPWCGPCQNLMPLIEEISKETNTELYKVNTLEEIKLTEKYGIMSLPTILIMKKGIIIKEIIGTRSKQVYLDALK